MANKKHTYGDPRGPRPKKNLANMDEYGLTRADLADRLNKDVSTIGKWIKGTAEMPNAEVVTAAMVLHVHPFYILDLTDNANMDTLTDYDTFAAERETKPGFWTYTHASKHLTNASARNELAAMVRKAEQTDDPGERQKLLDLMEERYPGDYRDLTKFTADMLAMLPTSWAAHDGYVDGDLLVDFAALYAATAIGKTFNGGPWW